MFTSASPAAYSRSMMPSISCKHNEASKRYADVLLLLIPNATVVLLEAHVMYSKLCPSNYGDGYSCGYNMKPHATVVSLKMLVSLPSLPPLSPAGMATSRGSIGKSSSNSSQEDPVTDVRLHTMEECVEGVCWVCGGVDREWWKEAGECTSN